MLENVNFNKRKLAMINMLTRKNISEREIRISSHKYVYSKYSDSSLFFSCLHLLAILHDKLSTKKEKAADIGQGN